MNAAGANAMASIRMEWMSVTTHVSARKRAGSSTHAGGVCPCSVAICSTVAASNASHRLSVSGGAPASTFA